MQGDDLMTQDIVSRRDIARDSDGPGVVVRDHGVGGPVARVATGEEADAVDLEPAQGGLIDGCAVAVAVGEVVGDGAVVGGGPWRPLDGER